MLRPRRTIGRERLDINASENGKSRSAAARVIEQRRMEAAMVEILLIVVVAVLVFLCVVGPGGEIGSGHLR